MKRRRHTPEQAVRKIREGERLLNEGGELVEVLRQLEVSEATWNCWRAQYGGMKADEAKRLKQLEGENQRLKKLVAEQALNIDMLKELVEGRMKVKLSLWSSFLVAAVGGASQRRCARRLPVRLGRFGARVCVVPRGWGRRGCRRRGAGERLRSVRPCGASCW
jgi:putative transposase